MSYAHCTNISLRSYALAETSNGVLFEVVGVAQDVTEDRKHAQMLREMQYIRASQEAKVETERNMTAYFAHELRNRKLLQDSNYARGYLFL